MTYQQHCLYPEERVSSKDKEDRKESEKQEMKTTDHNIQQVHRFLVLMWQRGNLINS